MRYILCLAAISALAFSTAAGAATVKIAGFDDPSPGGDYPLFEVCWEGLDNGGAGITGGWGTTGWGPIGAGLTLSVPYANTTIENVIFELVGAVPINNIIDPPGDMGYAGPGQFKFYLDGQQANPLLVYDFDSAFVSRYVLGAQDYYMESDNVTISGSLITETLYNEQFSFGFSNVTALNGGTCRGFTATASFTSSAIPEPATIALLAMGGAVLLRRKR